MRLATVVIVALPLVVRAPPCVTEMVSVILTRLATVMIVCTSLTAKAPLQPLLLATTTLSVILKRPATVLIVCTPLVVRAPLLATTMLSVILTRLATVMIVCTSLTAKALLLATTMLSVKLTRPATVVIACTILVARAMATATTALLYTSHAMKSATPIFVGRMIQALVVEARMVDPLSILPCVSALWPTTARTFSSQAATGRKRGLLLPTFLLQTLLFRTRLLNVPWAM